MKVVSVVLLSDSSPPVPLRCIKPLVLGLRRPSEEFYHSLAKWNALTKNCVLVSKILSIH